MGHVVQSKKTIKVTIFSVFPFLKKMLSAVDDLKNTFCKSKYDVHLQDRWWNQFMGVVLFENHSGKIVWDLSMTQGK